MFFVLIAVLIIILFGILFFIVLVRDKYKFRQLIKNNIVKIVIILHLVYVSIVFVFSYIIIKEFNYASIGCLFIILFSIIILVLNKKLSKNKKWTFLTIILFVLIICFVPVYSISGHYHVISEIEENTISTIDENIENDYTEIIINYIDYRNCYFIKIYTAYE